MLRQQKWRVKIFLLFSLKSNLTQGSLVSGSRLAAGATSRANRKREMRKGKKGTVVGLRLLLKEHPL